MPRLRVPAPRAALIVVACISMIALAGCWMAAAPLASTVMSMAGSIGRSTPITHANEDTAQDLECDLTNPAWPSLVELRTDKAGTTIYRPLSLSGPGLNLQYEDVDAPASTTGDWRLASDFAKLHFAPPLRPALGVPSTTYLAYAPATAQSPIERRQAASLQHDFSPVLGTFDWDGRVYRYALVRQLPCAASRVEAPTAAGSRQRVDRISPGPQR
ncbi:MAG: hypothetical protein ACREQX_14565 [Candidatus Binataceae bacterium]